MIITTIVPDDDYVIRHDDINHIGVVRKPRISDARSTQITRVSPVVYYTLHRYINTGTTFVLYILRPRPQCLSVLMAIRYYYYYIIRFLSATCNSIWWGFRVIIVRFTFGATHGRRIGRRRDFLDI